MMEQGEQATASPCLPATSHRQALAAPPATWSSPPAHMGVGACCSRKGAVGRPCFPGMSWAGPGKPSPRDSQQDSSLILRGRCNVAAPAAGLLSPIYRFLVDGQMLESSSSSQGFNLKRWTVSAMICSL